MRIWTAVLASLVFVCTLPVAEARIVSTPIPHPSARRRLWTHTTRERPRIVSLTSPTTGYYHYDSTTEGIDLLYPTDWQPHYPIDKGLPPLMLVFTPQYGSLVSTNVKVMRFDVAAPYTLEQMDYSFQKGYTDLSAKGGYLFSDFTPLTQEDATTDGHKGRSYTFTITANAQKMFVRQVWLNDGNSLYVLEFGMPMLSDTQQKQDQAVFDVIRSSFRLLSSQQ